MEQDRGVVHLVNSNCNCGAIEVDYFGNLTPNKLLGEVASLLNKYSRQFDIGENLEGRRSEESPLGDCAKSLLEGRKTSYKVFGCPNVSSGPAWDILLDLFVSERECRKVSVSDAGHSAYCPQTTSLRWLAILREEGLIERIPDDEDKRRTFLRLTDVGREKVAKAISGYRLS